MNLNALANIACEELPEGWELVISMEAGAASVHLYDPCGDSHHDASNFEDTIHEQVIQAICYAKAEHKESTQ